MIIALISHFRIIVKLNYNDNGNNDDDDDDIGFYNHKILYITE